MEHYKIVVSIGTIEISSHDKNWVEEKEKKYSDAIRHLLSRTDTTAKKEDAKVKESSGQVKPHKVGKIPVNEFYRTYIHSKDIKSRPDIVTFFIYFLSKIEERTDIQSSDVKDLFKQVGYPGWNKINITDALRQAKKKAFLNSVGNNWLLTITGEDFVLNTISE